MLDIRNLNSKIAFWVSEEGEETYMLEKNLQLEGLLSQMGVTVKNENPGQKIFKNLL